MLIKCRSRQVLFTHLSGLWNCIPIQYTNTPSQPHYLLPMHNFTPCVAFLVLLRIMAATKYVFFSDCFSHVSFLCGCTVVVPWSIKQLQLYNDNCSILLSYAFLQPSSSLYLPLLLFCFAPSLIPLSPFFFSLPSPSVLILYPPLSLPLFLSSLSSSSSSPPSSSDPNAYSMSKVNLSVGHDPSLRGIVSFRKYARAKVYIKSA